MTEVTGEAVQGGLTAKVAGSPPEDIRRLVTAGSTG